MTYRWRTIDIVVASVIAAAFGVIFWAWGILYNGADAAFTLLPAGKALLYGVWFLPGVVAGLVVRKPGAALYAETLAALISAALGSVWGTSVIVEGLLQGVGAELGFAVFRYRYWRPPAALLAAALSGLAAAVFDYVVWNGAYSVSYRIWYAVFTVASAVVVAGWGGWALTRALAQTGVLDRFPSGRERAVV
jgi:energy-coupling factor transport system substrate-specific component